MLGQHPIVRLHQIFMEFCSVAGLTLMRKGLNNDNDVFIVFAAAAAAAAIIAMLEHTKSIDMST